MVPVFPRGWWLVLFLASGAAAQELPDDPPPPSPVWEELLRLRTRLEALEGQRPGEAATPAEPRPIDLSGEETSTLKLNGDHVLSRPWYENLTFSGYGAFDYFDSGGTGTTPDGSFIVKEASLFLDAQVWDRVKIFTEVWLARYQYGNGFTLGEFYLQFSDLLARESRAPLGLKVGRFEIPFGEEYLRWDANVAPLITFTAADPYGIDEGVELYGEVGSFNWIAAVTNGNGTGADDGSSKQVAGKIYGDVASDLFLSGSLLAMGETESSALRLSGSTITPVGLEGPSTAGTSPSSDVDTWCWELDTRIAAQRPLHLDLQFGKAFIDDEVEAFDRDLTWFVIEPGFQLRHDLEFILRWSEIGTYDGDEGYRFAGRIVADGESFGYDTEVLRRASAGLRWTMNPHLTFKLEVGEDHIDLIDASTQDPDNDERLFFGLEVVGSF